MFPGNFAIWRNKTKKYIRNVGKLEGNFTTMEGHFDHVPGIFFWFPIILCFHLFLNAICVLILSDGLHYTPCLFHWDHCYTNQLMLTLTSQQRVSLPHTITSLSLLTDKWHRWLCTLHRFRTHKVSQSLNSYFSQRLVGQWKCSIYVYCVVSLTAR